MPAQGKSFFSATGSKNGHIFFICLADKKDEINIRDNPGTRSKNGRFTEDFVLIPAILAEVLPSDIAGLEVWVGEIRFFPGSTVLWTKVIDGIITADYRVFLGVRLGRKEGVFDGIAVGVENSTSTSSFCPFCSSITADPFRVK